MFLLFNLRLIHHSFSCSSAKNDFVHAPLIYQLKFSVVKTLRYTVLAWSSYVASYPVITIFRKLEIKKLDRDHACLCTSDFGTIFCGTIYVIINRPGRPFMLVIIGPYG